MRRLNFFLLLYFFIFIFSFNSYSLNEIKQSTFLMAKNATEIVVAKCISSEAKLDEKTGFVFTYTTFEVDQTVKSTIDSENILLRTIGGQVGNIRTDVQGMPRFNLQEEMVLFLGKKNDLGYYTLSSVLNGMYKVEIDEVSGEKMIKNAPTDMGLDNANSKQESFGNSTLLEDFISNLKDSL